TPPRRRCRARSIQIEVPRRFGDGLLLRLLQGFLESTRERIAARPLGRDRLLEQRFAPRRFLREDALRVVELGTLAGGWLGVPHDAPQVGIDHELPPAAGALHFEFRLQVGHRRVSCLYCLPRAPSSVTGRPDASLPRTAP